MFLDDKFVTKYNYLMKKLSNSFLLFVFAMCLNGLLVTNLQAAGLKTDRTHKETPNPDGKTVVSDYIKAIGGVDAIKKLNSTNATGTLSVQGMSMDVTQKRMAPNKTAQTIVMNGQTAAKTVFNGTKGYQEQMGNHMDMTDDQMADMKTQTAIVPQVDYLTNPSYQLSVLGTEKINNADAYKLLVTMPSGKSDTEFYDVASKLLVKQIISRTMNGQDAMATYEFSDYKKVADVMLPYKLSLSIASGTMSQSIDINLTDIKVNEGVTDADFE